MNSYRESCPSDGDRSEWLLRAMGSWASPDGGGDGAVADAQCQKRTVVNHSVGTVKVDSIHCDSEECRRFEDLPTEAEATPCWSADSCSKSVP